MNDEAVYRTAPATPGLLNIKISIKRKLQHFGFCDKTVESFNLFAAQNPLGLGTLFPCSSAF